MPMPKCTARANAKKSTVRATVEQVFAQQKQRMKLTRRSIGLQRAAATIFMANITYNVTIRFGPPYAGLPDLRSRVLKDVLMDVACGAAGCGQRYLLVGRERRRRWSPDDKLQIVREAFASGARVALVARRRDVASMTAKMPLSASRAWMSLNAPS
jgi:hypothetical protein